VIEHGDRAMVMAAKRCREPNVLKNVETASSNR
jgi:hypothetical protein